MRKRNNTHENSGNEEIMQVSEEMTEEFREQEEERQSDGYETESSDCGEMPAASDHSLPAQIERFTQREELDGHKQIRLMDVLGGEILTRETFKKQWGIIALCAFLTILYITNRYQAQQELIEISALKVELQKKKYYSLTRSGEYTIKSRQSQIEEILKKTADSTLTTPIEPPFIIYTTEKTEE